MTKAMNIKDFTYLLLAMLADKSKVINLKNKSLRTISLPNTFKESIEKISVTDSYTSDADEKSFVSVLVTDGKGKIDENEIGKGDSLFIPANYGEFTVTGKIELIITRV